MDGNPLFPRCGGYRGLDYMCHIQAKEAGRQARGKGEMPLPLMLFLDLITPSPSRKTVCLDVRLVVVGIVRLIPKLCNRKGCIPIGEN